MSQSELMDQYQDVADEFIKLMDNTNVDKPAKKDVKSLRRFLREYPELWAFAGDLAEQAILDLVGKLQATPALKESLKMGYLQMQKELGLENSTPLERLLIQQVVMCWLRLAYVEYQYTAVTHTSGSFQKLNYWEGRLNASQRRFLRATSTLARIRKLNLPPIQVNIGQNQVNQVQS